jgi:hypothetical protein
MAPKDEPVSVPAPAGVDAAASRLAGYEITHASS